MSPIKRFLQRFTVIAVLLGMTACSNMNSQQQSMLSGGAIGAGVGVVGTVVTGGCVACGAVIGGAVGTGAGYVVDKTNHQQ